MLLYMLKHKVPQTAPELIQRSNGEQGKRNNDEDLYKA